QARELAVVAVAGAATTGGNMAGVGPQAPGEEGGGAGAVQAPPPDWRDAGSHDEGGRGWGGARARAGRHRAGRVTVKPNHRKAVGMRYKPEAPARVDVNPRWRFGLVCGRLSLACASGLYAAIPSQSKLFTFPVAARRLTSHDESGSIPAFV